MPFSESISNTEEVVVRGVMVALTVMVGLRFVVKEGCDIYEELHRKVKRCCAKRSHGTRPTLKRVAT